ncbi:MAG: M48 family metalloprotease [Actinomycetota bacterium]
MGRALRMTLPAGVALVALPVIVGIAFVELLDAPIWLPALLAVVFLVLQFVFAPFLIQWLTPARRVVWNGERYETDHPVGELLARRCRQAGIPMARLGIVDDGNPNAFTFGHIPHDARIYVTTGLLERLDDDELDAVLAHEVGHVKHWDFVVMTAAGVVPMLLYFFALSARNAGDPGRAAALVSYIGYWLSFLFLLAVNRARERAADHWSCEATGNGDALASALVKIAYGMGTEQRRHREEIERLRKRKDKAGLRRATRADNRAHSMRVMGIADPRAGEVMAAAVQAGFSRNQVLGAVQWDLVNPWAGIQQLFASHPLVARRIGSLERSGLPGAPQAWSVAGVSDTADPAALRMVRRAFLPELFLRFGSIGLLAGAGAAAYLGASVRSIGVLLLAAGLLLLAKQFLRYPMRHRRVPSITSLLERIDAGPVRGLAVELEGRVVGRGTPGYLLSPDLVLRDESGFVVVDYRNPIPFADWWFGLTQAELFQGCEGVVRGWYRRTPTPVVELRSLRTTSAQTARGYWWITAYLASAAWAVAGLLMITSTIA